MDRKKGNEALKKEKQLYFPWWSKKSPLKLTKLEMKRRKKIITINSLSSTNELI